MSLRIDEFESAHSALRASPRVSVVIPTLNEAENLPHVLADLPADIYEVVLVDGWSTDETIEVARQFYPDVCIVGQTARGKGNALACGFAEVRGDIVVMLDADGSADPLEIRRFVQELEDGADFAKGSRFLPGGGSDDITLLRRLGNALLVRLVNLLYGSRYTDLCYGYNAFWARYIPVIDVDCNGFEVETLINLRIAKAGLTVKEVPSFERERLHGKSNLHPFRDGFRVLGTIIREWSTAPIRESTDASSPTFPGAMAGSSVPGAVASSTLPGIVASSESTQSLTEGTQSLP